MEEFKLWTGKELDDFFEDEFIEDSGLSDFLKGRKASIEWGEDVVVDNTTAESRILVIKVVMSEQ